MEAVLPKGLVRLYLRHALWALRMARLVPLLAMIFIMSLAMCWFFLPGVILSPILILLMHLMAEGWLLANIAALLISGGVLIVVTPWLFGWYWIALNLMIGRAGPAEKKTDELIYAIRRMENAGA